MFEGIILVLIVYGSVLLTIDNNAAVDGSPIRRFLDVNDLVLTTLFTLELVIKVIAYGLAIHPGAYLRSSWNQLDFIIVLTSLLSLVVQNKKLRIFKTLRLIRALRPLRMISRLKGMQLVV